MSGWHPLYSPLEKGREMGCSRPLCPSDISPASGGNRLPHTTLGFLLSQE